MTNIRKENPKEYRAWKAMRNRCNNTNYHAYHRYGGRGIKVCDRWLEEAVNMRKNFIVQYNKENNADLKYEEFIK